MQFLTTVTALALAAILLPTNYASCSSIPSKRDAPSPGPGPWAVSAVPKTSTSLPGTLFPQLSYISDDMVYAGNAKFHTQSEKLILSGGTGGFSFISWKSVPTGFQLLYAFTNGAHPLGFTLPHSGGVPSGASVTGWSIDTKGKISFQNSGTFLACPVGGKTVGCSALQDGSYQIWYKSPGTKDQCTGGIEIDLLVSATCLS